MLKNGTSEIWRIIATVLITVFLTFLFGWLTMGRSVATKTEITEMIKTQAPYVQDRQLLQEAVRGNTLAVRDIRDDLMDIMITQAIQSGKLDMLLDASVAQSESK